MSLSGRKKFVADVSVMTEASERGYAVYGLNIKGAPHLSVSCVNTLVVIIIHFSLQGSARLKRRVPSDVILHIPMVDTSLI